MDSETGRRAPCSLSLAHRPSLVLPIASGNSPPTIIILVLILKVHVGPGPWDKTRRLGVVLPVTGTLGGYFKGGDPLRVISIWIFMHLY